jgi:glycosyltransferase involved in cell wall biosynthesis
VREKLEMDSNISIAAHDGRYPVREDSHKRVERLPVRTALLTNCIAPYSLPVWRILSTFLDRFRVYVSIPMEADRPWGPMWDGVDVTLQRSFATRHLRTYSEGFSERFVRHFPYDTLPSLYQFKPDVIVSAQLGFRTMQAAAYRLLNKSCRLVIWADLSMHTEREVGTIQTSIRRLLLRSADAVVVNGASGFEYVERLGVPGDRITVAPYVTEMAPLMSLSLSKDPRVARRLLFVGQLIERKGLEPFLRSLVEWATAHPDHPCEMWFVGDGPLRKCLEKFPRPSNVDLRFFGNVSYEEIYSFYARVGIFVFPTLQDTWGLAVNEAMAAGLPVLGSRYSQAVQDLVTEGSNGWLFHADRPEELSGALNRAMTCHLSKLSEMSGNARQTIEKLTPLYSAERFLQAIEIAHSANNHREEFDHE